MFVANNYLLPKNNNISLGKEFSTMELEKKLSQAITEKGISVRSIATRAGMDEQVLYRCLRAEQRLKADEFLAVCKVAELNPADFL